MNKNSSRRIEQLGVLHSPKDRQTRRGFGVARGPYFEGSEKKLRYDELRPRRGRPNRGRHKADVDPR